MSLCVTSAIVNEDMQHIGRITSLERLELQSYSGTEIGLKWLAHMPSLKKVQLGDRVDEEMKKVVPKEILAGKPVVAHGD